MSSAQWVYDRAMRPGGIAELVSSVLTSRGMRDDEMASFLAPDFELGLHDPFALPDMDKAVDRLAEAIKKREKIAIYGDYDIDGLTACSLLLDGLRQFGAEASVYIPDRFEEGYGLNSEALRRLAASGVSLVVTVDCGVTAAEPILDAQKAGLDVIVTDHHNPPADLPTAACALINPKLPESIYPNKELAGVGVAYKLIIAMQKKLPNLMPAGQEKWLLDLVALGTVCDVVPLVGENRTLVLFGLKVLARSKRIGIQALAEASGVNLKTIKSADLGFRLGPRLNAAGRLVHANLALELLTSTDVTKARSNAQKLNQLNAKRQEQTTKVVTEAAAAAEEQADDMILVLADDDWSHGIVGIAAARIAEKYNKPTILLQTQGDLAKGSCRSAGNFSIIDGLTDCSDLLEKFGGHSYAAGLTIKTDNIDTLRSQLNQYAEKLISKIDLARKIEVDLLLPADLLCLEAAIELARLEPHGNQNRQPILASQLVVKEIRPVGSSGEHLKLIFAGNNGQIDGIAFSSADRWSWLEPDKSVEVLYRLGINEWRDTRRPQLEVIDIREAVQKVVKK